MHLEMIPEDYKMVAFGSLRKGYCCVSHTNNSKMSVPNMNRSLKSLQRLLNRYRKKANTCDPVQQVSGLKCMSFLDRLPYSNTLDLYKTKMTHTSIFIFTGVLASNQEGRAASLPFLHPRCPILKHYCRWMVLSSMRIPMFLQDRTTSPVSQLSHIS
jgi:hypothetical protein